ncbi:MAG TPA: methyltransferase domain-containing protein [Acidimicrobiia bacterium]|nr:methyltransferase domain-containing protein [Acidimicrobiia bacterium]
MGQGRYVFDTAAEGEGDRLETLQQACDPTTFRHLGDRGVGPGWTCLEVAAGKGSVAEWLCGRVGDTGRVVATDLSTLYLDKIDAPNLEVRRHDIVHDDLETGVFDLVHCRFLLEHLPEREALLRKMAAALAPGGWLVVEDVDVVTYQVVRGRGRFVVPVVARAMATAVTRHGYDPRFGGRLPRLMRQAGLTEVGGEGRAIVLPGGPETSAWVQPSFVRVRQMFSTGEFGEAGNPGRVARAMVRWPAAARVMEGLLVRSEAFFANPEVTIVSPPIMTAWGRRPA